MSIWENIASYIKDNNIQLATLADRSNLKETTLKNLLDGSQQGDCIEYYIICKALRVPLDTFMKRGTE